MTTYTRRASEQTSKSACTSAPDVHEHEHEHEHQHQVEADLIQANLNIFVGKRASEKRAHRAASTAQRRQRAIERAKRRERSERAKFSDSWLQYQESSMDGEFDNWTAGGSIEDAYNRLCRELNDY